MPCNKKILFFVDSYYINSAGVFFECMTEDFEYAAFSQQTIRSDIGNVTFASMDYIDQVVEVTFDYIVIASEKADEVFDMLESFLHKHEYQVMTMLEVAAYIMPFEGYINYLRMSASSLIPNNIPSKILEKRYQKYSSDMHIIMSFNSKFLLPSLTTIYTTFLYNDNCRIHIFYKDLTQSERTIVERLTRLGNNNHIEWHFINNDLHNRIHFDTGRFSIYTLYRFLAYKILDEKIEKCLWLDSDLMIRGSIRELYETNMGDDYYFSSALEAADYENNILGKNREYTNIGVLLMNIKKLRSDDMMDKFWDLLFSPDFNYPTLEQDAMNIVFRYKILFHKQILWNSFPITDLSDIPNSEFPKIVNKTRIVHWLSAQKAWLPEYEQYWKTVSEQYPYAQVMYEEYQKRLVESIDFVSVS